MNKKIDEIGNKYGRLLVINPAMSMVGRACWRCVCDCGNEHIAMGKLLRAGKVKSCGCWSIDNPPRKLPGNLGAQRQKFRDYKKAARERGIIFDLSFEYFISLIGSECFYCGAKPEEFNGVDRKDNIENYTLENCVPCCWECNRYKFNNSYDSFIGWIERVANHVL